MPLFSFPSYINPLCTCYSDLRFIDRYFNSILHLVHIIKSISISRGGLEDEKKKEEIKKPGGEEGESISRKDS